MKFSVYQVSRQAGRARNEDRLGYTYTRQAVLLVLADGMGGHPQGDLAAELAVQVFVRRFQAQAQPDLPNPVHFLEDAVLAASQAIVDHAQAQRLSDHPRTTVVAAVLQNGQLTALHCGDSRLYWVRLGRLVQRTRDHTYHDKPELFTHLPADVHRSVLFTCLGSDVAPLYDVLGPVPLQRGDGVLLCSDGLWSVMPDSDIAAGLHGLALPDALGQLADEAVALGGRHGDNVSLLGLQWEHDDHFESTQVVLPQAGFDVSQRWADAVLAGDPVADLADFDDAAIERSIAEINEAIRRTARPGEPLRPVAQTQPGPT